MSKIRKPYDKAVRVSFECEGDSRTKQSMREECDLNVIMSKARRTGLVSHLARFEGRYGDFVGYEDYHDSVNRILAADEMFLSVPASIRKRFDNDPAEFLRFVQDPDNEAELISMGLAKAPEAPTEPENPAQGDVGDGGAAASEAS